MRELAGALVGARVVGADRALASAAPRSSAARRRRRMRDAGAVPLLRPLVEIDALDRRAAVDQAPDAGALDLQHVRRGLGDLLERAARRPPAPAPANASDRRAPCGARRSRLRCRDGPPSRAAGRCGSFAAVARAVFAAVRARRLAAGRERRLTIPGSALERNKVITRRREVSRRPHCPDLSDTVGTRAAIATARRTRDRPVSEQR